MTGESYKYTLEMKKIIILALSSMMLMISVKSQNIDDALRYSRTFYQGTARFNAMGGAFTALGADLSAISLNPAGVGMYRSFEMSFTPQLLYNNTSSVFNNSSSTDFRYEFGFNQAGVVANLIANNNTAGLITLNAAYSYVRTNNFNENITINGISDNSSMADYWAISSDGVYYTDLSGTAGIVYDAWVMDTITGTGAQHYATVFSNYGDNPNSTYGQTMRRLINNDGYSGEHAFSIGGNYSDKVFFGATLGIAKLRYTGHYEHLEADYDEVIPDFRNFTYTDHFEADGTGFSLKVGTIIRPVELLRIGLAFHSPVIYRIKEYYYDNISSQFDDGGKYSFSNEPYRYTYTLTTPFKAMAGVSVQLQKLGIISADYEIIDYRMARFSNASDDYNYYDENESVRDILKPSSNIRLGAEFRLNNLYLRGGYGLYGKAFRQGEENDDLVYNSISAGIGFRQANFFFDMSFTNLSSKQRYFMYNDPPYLDAATIKTNRNTFAATLGFKF